MNKFHSYIFGLLLLGVMAACTSNNIDPGAGLTDTYQSNLADISTYATSKGLSGTSTNSGLYYVLTKPGASSVATAYGQEIEFTYTLYVLSRSTGNPAVVTDKKVDSSYAATSVFFPFYAGSLKPGLEEGLLKMREGDQATLLMPATLAFGDVTTGPIPANSPVRFDVTLKRARTEDQQIDEYLTAKQLTPTEVSTTGLRFIKTLTNPTGAVPTPAQTLNVKYAGRLLRATSAFDSTGTGTAPFKFGETVPGFNEALTKLRVGEKATIVFPSRIGYGTTGKGNIPPYSPMRFDIELVSVQ